jgi:predicted naringenin-chalcone synthase
VVYIILGKPYKKKDIKVLVEVKRSGIFAPAIAKKFIKIM